MNIEKILKMPLETLLVVFFNTSLNKNNDFEIISSYRETKFLKLDVNSYKLTAVKLTNKYKIKFELKNDNSIISIIKNDKNISLNDFLNLIYENIIIKIPKLEYNYSLDIEIATALFLLRESADFNRFFYSVDLKNPTPLYIENIFKILLSSDKLLSKLNFNFRELQPQYISGENKRNSQIRINLKWFFDNVIQKYKNINEYKTNILISNQFKLGEDKDFLSFEKRLIFYRENILGRKLEENEIKEFRQELEFEKNNIEKSIFNTRNQKIVTYAREILEDKCVGCCDKYDIKDRSFKMYKTDRYYLEINHIISYASDSNNVDVLDNLVKLCPTCHRILTPNRANPQLQKEIIEKMIKSRIQTEKFINKMMPKNYKSSIDYVFDSLR